MNRNTHDYANLRTARIHGWRRHWVQSNRRDAAFLSVQPDPLSSIEGLIADVAGVGWEALDVREAAYNRFTLSVAELRAVQPLPVQMYRANPDYMAPQGSGKPILMSYLDCVVQGFLAEFGDDGVRDFFRTTTGWDTPVRDDRADPIYPRAQIVTPFERDLVDTNLQTLNVNIV